MFGVKRQELKYQITQQEAALLKCRLEHVMKRDPHASEKPYFIRSVYFDNKANESFYGKIEGLERRKKIRFRFYDFASNTVKFELKQKENDTILKGAGAVKRAEMREMLRGRYEALLHAESLVLKRIYYELKRDYFEPIVVVDYRRDAFFLEYNHIRVTFDDSLRKSDDVEACENPNLRTLPVLEKQNVILEIKYNLFFPTWLKKVFTGIRLQRQANSKYCLARILSRR